MHGELGWLYGLPQSDDTAGVWLWHAGMGMDVILYPYLYQNDSGSWMFLHGREREEYLLFYDYQLLDESGHSLIF